MEFSESLNKDNIKNIVLCQKGILLIQQENKKYKFRIRDF